MKFTSILFAAAMIQLANCQTPIPSRLEGVELGNAAAPSRLDVFVDAHCPFSQKFFTVLKSSLDLPVKGKPLKEQLSINIHIFVLPFHHNSFLAAAALNYFRNKHIDHFSDFLEIQFNSIDKYNSGSKDLPQTAVQALLIEDAKTALGKDVTPDVTTIYDDPAYNSGARITFKYGASRGVNGAPTLFMNQVIVGDVPFTNDDLIAFVTDFVN